MSSAHLVLIRHGQSEWNQKNLFTGWVDIDLSEKGREEARKAGQLLKTNKVQFNRAFCSLLKRAIRTLWIVLDELDQMWIPVQKSWRLNERHYGSLTGLNKKELVQKYGEEQVRLWRRDYQTQPPDMGELSTLVQQKLFRSGDLPHIPTGESLSQTQDRVVPFWRSSIVPFLKEGQTVLVVAHGNSLRALIQHIEDMTEHEVSQLEIPTGVPIAYTLPLPSLAPAKRDFCKVKH